MFGWFLLVLLGLLLLLLAMPVVLFAEYEGDFTLTLGYLFFHLKLWPQPPGEEKPPEEKKPQPKKTEKPEQSKKEKPSHQEMFALAKELLEGLWPPVRWLLQTIVCYDVFFGMRVAGEDAAQTAISCGRYNAAAFGLCGFLNNFIRLKRVRISIFPDFIQEESEIRFRGKVRFIPLAVLAAGIAILVALLVKLIPMFLRSKKKREEKTEESTQQNKGGVTI